MRTFRLKVREVQTVIHVVKVPDHFRPYPQEEINDWIQELSEQNSEPIETVDIQVQDILEAEEVQIN